jgi:NAD(P)-dependent dehydrogenase (short-subunit alcohol dehydrogenase family)
MRSVVVTGASTGIGHACVRLLLDRGFQVFGSVRRPADAERLANAFGARFTPLLFDVTDEAAVGAAAALVRQRLNDATLAGLVNNAGIAVAGPLLDLPVGDFRRQLDVNVLGPVIVTKAFAPLLGADRSLQGPPGRIVMMSSVAGHNGNPLLSPYCASKHALEGLSESLRREFMLFGIDVVVIGPGAVKTPIWDKADEIDAARFKASPYAAAVARLRDIMHAFAARGLPPEQIAGLVHDALTVPKPRTRYAATPDPGRMLMMRILPKRWLDRIIARQLGLLPPR